MKQTFLFTLLALLGLSQAAAQEYEYVPFVREGVKWVYNIHNNPVIFEPQSSLPNADYCLNLEMKGDTLINGKTYKAMHKYYGAAISVENDTVPIYLREEDKVVYGIIPNGEYYHDCPVYTLDFGIDEYDGNEFVLYDFRDTHGYWEYIANQAPIYYYDDLGTDTISIGKKRAKCHKLSFAGINRMNYVEGIGLDSSASGFTLNYLMGWAPGLAIFDLSHVIEDGEIIYKGMGYRPGVVSGVDEAVADQSRRPLDENYYDLTGRAVGKEVPTTPGIYIHQGKKICVR